MNHVNRDKILIIGPAWIGDMIMTQTLFKNIKKQKPSAKIHVLAPRWTFPLLNRMPEVDRAIESPFQHRKLQLKDRFRLGKKLREEQYSQAIVLQNSWKSALVPFFARIPTRTGWHGECRYLLLNDRRKLDKERYPLMIERFMALGFPAEQTPQKPYPNPAFSINPEKAQAVLKKFKLNAEKPILALCPGAQYGESKRWPPEYFATVAEHKIKAGWQVFIFGSQNDAPAAQQIRQKLAHHTESVYNFCGKTDLNEAIDLLSHATLVITNDSGLMHVAAALNIELIAIYGSSTPSFTPPLSNRAKIVSLNLPCSPCFKRSCPKQHFRCMMDLTPDKVLEA